MAGIKHTKEIEGTNNPAVQVSKDAWNEEHSIDDQSIGVAKINASGTPSASTFLCGDGQWVEALSGDMEKSTYDTDNDGIIDNSEKLEGSTKAQVQDHTPKAHGNEAHTSTFLTSETDPTVDATLKGVTKSQVQDHTPKSHGNEAHTSAFLTEVTSHGNEKHSSTFLTSVAEGNLNLSCNNWQRFN